MKAGWQLLPFDAVLADESGGSLKTPQSQFLTEGLYPVVDQGRELVAGYVNDPANLCRVELPVIVFGDHTRRFKYVDFPFCKGADGTKVLRPKVDADVRYLYHYLRYLRLPEGGYDRHFKYLRRAEVVFPPPADQRRIAEVLDRADALRVKRRAAIAQFDTLRTSIFMSMFGDPISNPKGYPVRSLADIVDPARPITYGILMPGPVQASGVKYVRVVDMQDGGISLADIRATTEAISGAYRRSLLKTGDLLMSIRGHVGRFAFVPPDLDEANITQDTARLAIEGADPTFVRECLRTKGFQAWMAGRTKGAAVRGINLGDVKQMPIIQPPLESQREFARKAGAVDRLLTHGRESLNELDHLFVSLQGSAFTGQL